MPAVRLPGEGVEAPTVTVVQSSPEPPHNPRIHETHVVVLTAHQVPANTDQIVATEPIGQVGQIEFILLETNKPSKDLKVGLIHGTDVTAGATIETTAQSFIDPLSSPDNTVPVPTIPMVFGFYQLAPFNHNLENRSEKLGLVVSNQSADAATVQAQFGVVRPAPSGYNSNKCCK